MNVSLTPELARFIAAQLEAGRYRSASEVVREGLLCFSIARKNTLPSWSFSAEPSRKESVSWIEAMASMGARIARQLIERIQPICTMLAGTPGESGVVRARARTLAMVMAVGAPWTFAR